MKPLSGVAVILVSETGVIPYSAMVPEYIGGDYGWDEITIDLVRLCRASGVRFIPGQVVKVSGSSRTIHFSQRPEISYDVLSLGAGLCRPIRPVWTRSPVPGCYARWAA